MIRVINFLLDMGYSLRYLWLEEGVNSLVKVAIQLIIGKGPGRLMKGIGQLNRIEIRKVALQVFLCGREAQERIVDRHGEVAWDFGFLQLRFELGGQDLADLDVQHFDGTCLCSWKFFLEWDGGLELASLLQDPDDV